MARNPRCLLTSIPYHVTQRGNNRQDVFYSQQDREVYLDLVERERSEARVRLLAYALMTNHVHWLVEPERGDSLAVFFRRVHGRYAQYLNARRGQSGHLWQGRFHACIVEPRRLEVALRYVERNPVRAGLAAEPGAYEWSSARAHLTGQFGREVFLESGVLERERGCGILVPDAGAGGRDRGGLRVAAVHVRGASVRRRGLFGGDGTQVRAGLEAVAVRERMLG